jgi:Calx-beta domain
MNMQAKTSNLWTPLRLGLLAGLIGISVSLESSARPPADFLLPRLKISNVTVSEPNFINHTNQATLTVTLDRKVLNLPDLNLPGWQNNQTIQPVSVDFKTVDGSATADDDYVPQLEPFRTLTFSGQETTKTIKVDIYGDDLDEGNEDLFVWLSNPQGAVLSDGQGQIIINNTPGTNPPGPKDECPEGQVLHAGICRPVHMQR